VRRLIILLLLALLTVSAVWLPQGTSICDYHPLTAQFRAQLQQDTWIAYLKDLSGERPVWIDGIERTIETRNSYAMGLHRENALAVEYILQTLLQWYAPDQIEIDYYPAPISSTQWKNVILTIEGKSNPSESVLMTAHLDSRMQDPYDPTSPAPGADDNASGSAALLEAARAFRDQSFERSIQLIWFSGEEQVMLGSLAYAADHDLTGVVGVYNLDMFSYDGDGDRCFELHVGTQPESQPVGQCFVDTLAAYPMNLTYDYITTGATIYSDHSSFWKRGIGALMVLENFYFNELPGGCTGTDKNPYYHTPQDTLANMDLNYGFAIASTATLAVHRMAGPMLFNDRLYLPLILYEHSLHPSSVVKVQ
jgi:leucyl aminopeptidase